MKRLCSIVLIVAVAAGVAACGEDSQVGDRALLDFQEQAQERLGEATTTTTTPAEEAPVTTAPSPQAAQPGREDQPATTPTAPAPAQQAPVTTATTAPAAPERVFDLEITINGDDSAEPPFSPQLARVFVGSVVRWTNHDSVPRQVVFEGGRIAPSPSIPPGGTFDYRVTVTSPEGEPFRYGDGGRPYVTGYLEVLPR